MTLAVTAIIVAVATAVMAVSVMMVAAVITAAIEDSSSGENDGRSGAIGGDDGQLNNAALSDGTPLTI